MSDFIKTANRLFGSCVDVTNDASPVNLAPGEVLVDRLSDVHDRATVVDENKRLREQGRIAKLAVELREQPHPRMWFGKYKGELLTDVPKSYLQWCLRTMKFKSRPHDKALLEMAVSGELAESQAADKPLALEPPPEHRVAGRGKLDSPCKCGSDNYVDVTISGGRTRRDCAGCGRFISFPIWKRTEEMCEKEQVCGKCGGELRTVHPVES